MQKKRFKNLRNIRLLKFTLTVSLWILKKNIHTMEWMLKNATLFRISVNILTILLSFKLPEV